MHPIYVYIIQVNFALVLFYLLYSLILKSDTFLQIRRFYFISAIVFSLVYPCFVLPGLTNIVSFRLNEPTVVETVISIGAPSFEIISEGDTVETSSFHIPWKALLSIAYLVVTLFFIIRFLWQLVTILRMRMKSKKIIISGIEVYDLDKNVTPFSFLGMIFINSQMHSEEELAQIIIHEHTHVNEKHSLDVLLIEIVLLFSWWNPFVWLLKREMAMNLEYLADNGVLREGVDSRDYQYHLLRLTYHETAVQIVNNFNVSQLKQRIMMMNKSKSSTVQLVKYLLILPIVLLMLTANSLIAAEREPALVETNTANPVIELDENIILPDTYTSDTGTIQDPPPVKKDENMEEVFIVVEEMPQFWGGNEALIQFLVDSIQYPKIAMEKGIQGRVFCNFVVMSDGSVDDVKVVRGVDPVLDAEAVRVLKLMPNWKPGKQRGVAVNVRYTLPVVFSLGNNESKVEVNKPTAVGEKIMVTAQVQPSFIFPGGENAMLRFIANNIRYPVLAQEQSLQGLITASFNVSDAGKVTAVETNFNSGDMAILSKEVVRVFQQMPDWEKEDYLLVTGKVTKSGAHPLQGATVLIKGTNSGTITDDKGGFQLKVPAVDGVLVISFVGFETQEFPIKGVSVQKGEFTMRVPVVFKLQESDVKENSFNSEAYPENAIVVVGYGKK